jgi:hypothetical protein
MAKILSSDIDCLIDVTTDLVEFARMCNDPDRKSLFEQKASRVRKVYILLLAASNRGQMDLHDLCSKGFTDDDPVSVAIDNLCHGPN